MTAHLEVGGDAAPGGRSPGVRVKICGVRTVSDALAATGAGADMIGLNFFSGSKRCVDVETAAAIAGALPRSVWSVGVFVDAGRAEIQRTIEAVGLGAIQLHGHEGPELLRGWAVPVIRVVHVASDADVRAALARFEPDYFLAEGRSPAGAGGVGASFDWTLAAPLPPERLFVAGGLTPENVAAAVRALRPFAVDVASGVESTPGVKSQTLVARFVEHAKSA